MIQLAHDKATPCAQGDHAWSVVQLWPSMLTCVLIVRLVKAIRAHVSFTSHADTSWTTMCVTSHNAKSSGAAGGFWVVAKTGQCKWHNRSESLLLGHFKMQDVAMLRLL